MAHGETVWLRLQYNTWSYAAEIRSLFGRRFIRNLVLPKVLAVHHLATMGWLYQVPFVSQKKCKWELGSHWSFFTSFELYLLGTEIQPFHLDPESCCNLCVYIHTNTYLCVYTQTHTHTEAYLYPSWFSTWTQSAALSSGPSASSCCCCFPNNIRNSGDPLRI